MRFTLVDHAKEEFPVHRLCSVLGINQSRVFRLEEPAGQQPPASGHGVACAHPFVVRALERYLRSPRMMHEWRGSGLAAGLIHRSDSQGIYVSSWAV
jgi:putative transposase